MNTTLNIAAYRFVAIDDAAALRDSLHGRAAAAGLKGTILLANEGINIFLAGHTAAARGFFTQLQEDARFAGLEMKESWSATPPFGRLLVKVKREIIRMDRPAIRPEAGRAPAVDAATLARWLDMGHDDAGRAVVMLDTRNAFEVDHGRFVGALDWRLQRFGEFPKALETNRAALAGKTVVSYCTGGIRCEKAALLMREAGIEHVLQLDGGILKYFEQAGGRHFDGRCFVFDARETLASTLEPARV